MKLIKLLKSCYIMLASVRDSKLAIYRKRFQELDIENKRALSRDLVAQILSEQGTEIERLMVIILFECYDENQDTVIQEDEFINFCQEMERMTEKEILRRVFDLVDTDKNQRLDVAEVQKLGEMMGLEVSLLDAWATVDVLDSNHDNTVDFEEFLAIIERR